MSEQFRAAPSSYDALLGPVLTSARGSAWAIVSAVTMKGIHVDMAAADIRLWIRSRGMSDAPKGWTGASRKRSESYAATMPNATEAQSEWASQLGSILDSDTRWKQLVKAARKKDLSSSSVTDVEIRNARLKYTRQMYGWVLTPLPGDQPRQLKAEVNPRVMLTAIANMTIADEYAVDSVLLGMDEFAAMSGWGVSTAKRTRDMLLKLDMVTQPRSEGGRKARYRVRTIARATENANGEPNGVQLSASEGSRLRTATQFESSIESNADGKLDAIGAVLRSALHCTWTHSRVLNHGHWFMHLIDTAQLDPESFGIGLRTAQRLRRVLKRAQFPIASEHGMLFDLLDHLADDPEYGTIRDSGESMTARASWERTMDLDRERATRNARDGEERAAMKRDVWELVNKITEAYPLPRPKDTHRRSAQRAHWDRFTDWVLLVHPIIVEAKLEPEFAAAVERALVSRLAHQGYEGSVMRDCVQFIMRTPIDADLAEHLITAEEANESQQEASDNQLAGALSD